MRTTALNFLTFAGLGTLTVIPSILVAVAARRATKWFEAKQLAYKERKTLEQSEKLSSRSEVSFSRRRESAPPLSIRPQQSLADAALSPPSTPERFKRNKKMESWSIFFTLFKLFGVIYLTVKCGFWGLIIGVFIFFIATWGESENPDADYQVMDESRLRPSDENRDQRALTCDRCPEVNGCSCWRSV